MDVVVIGAGISGLAAALRLGQAGKSVTLLTKGIGGLQLSQGTVDVLGYDPGRVTEPYLAAEKYAADNGEHPYAVIGMDAVRAGVDHFAAAVGPELLTGDGTTNFQLPTAVGAVRPTALAQPSMVNGAAVAGAKFAIVGLRRIKDFYPELVAQNLSRTDVGGGGVSARAITVDVPARDREIDSSALVYARAFDDPDWRARLISALAGQLQEGESVGFPAFLGYRDHHAWKDFQDKLGCPVFEIPLPPPSVPGMRLNESLTALCRRAGVRIAMGSRVVAKRDDGNRVGAVLLDSAGHQREYPATDFVFAPGGFESGAIAVDSYMKVSEPVFGLPLRGADRDDLISEQYWDSQQPLFRVGVSVNDRMQPVNAEGAVVHENLYAAGGILAGATRWAEKSGEGIALGSAYRATSAILGEA